jgi:hypothetical protein
VAEHLNAGGNIVIAGPNAYVNIAGTTATPELAIRRVLDIDANKEDAWSAIELYARLPEDERYDDDVIIELIRRHLSGDFGPRRPASHWKAFFLVAKLGKKVCGMLLGYNYNNRQSNLVYVPYLIVSKPDPGTDNPRNVSQALVDALVGCLNELAHSDDPPLRFLAEVDDPRETIDPSERRERRARVRLFDRIAGFAKLNLRCLDYKFTQPKLEPWSDLPEKKLLILYGSQSRPPMDISKTEFSQIMAWLYKELYATNMSLTPDEDRQYQRYLEELFRSVREKLPNGVRALRLQQIYRETN